MLLRRGRLEAWNRLLARRLHRVRLEQGVHDDPLRPPRLAQHALAGGAAHGGGGREQGSLRLDEGAVEALTDEHRGNGGGDGDRHEVVALISCATREGLCTGCGACGAATAPGLGSSTPG